MRRVLALALLIGCSQPKPPPPPIAEFLSPLLVQDGTGPHGEYHRVNAEAERKYWNAISTLPILPDGDHLLAEALDQVYTRYDDNYWNGYLFHYPYLCTRKAVALAEKLLAEYPHSPLAETALWLKAYALRVMPPDPDGRLESDYPTFAEQVRHRPDPDGARAVLQELRLRFPQGRYAEAARMWLSKDDLKLKLLEWPKAGDPRKP